MLQSLKRNPDIYILNLENKVQDSLLFSLLLWEWERGLQWYNYFLELHDVEEVDLIF